MAVGPHTHLRDYFDPRAEYHAAKRCLKPMPSDPDRRVVAKFIAVLMSLAWLAITLGLAFAPDTVAVPPYFLAFTALLFTIIGRLWGIERQEVASYLPGSYGSRNQADEQERDSS